MMLQYMFLLDSGGVCEVERGFVGVLGFLLALWTPRRD